jgi:geranylgeranyl reductase family protein
MPTDTYDLAVIGGGPSGAIAAYETARRSLRVLLLEQEKLPRYKACGGVVAAHVENLVDFPIEPTIERRISRVMVTVRLQPPFVSTAPRPFAYLVMRDVFDSYLVETAARAGADVRQQTALTQLAEVEDGCVLTTTNGAFKAKYVIGADGAYSKTRKLVGAPHFQRLSVALEREIRTTPDLLLGWNDTIALDFGGLRSGYAWIFPKATNFSVGVWGPRSVAKRLRPYCDTLVEHYRGRIGDAEPYLRTGHHLPIRTPHERIVYNRVLLVGDAAGLVEPLTGEGIYYAMRSGQIAAEVIHEASRSGIRCLPTYQERIEEEIQPELQVSKSLLFLLDLAPTFWVPRLLRQSHPFWRLFYRIFTGEKQYQDIPRKFGTLGRLLFSLTRNSAIVTRDNLRPYD